MHPQPRPCLAPQASSSFPRSAPLEPVLPDAGQPSTEPDDEAERCWTSHLDEQTRTEMHAAVAQALVATTRRKILNALRRDHRQPSIASARAVVVAGERQDVVVRAHDRLVRITTEPRLLDWKPPIELQGPPMQKGEPPLHAADVLIGTMARWSSGLAIEPNAEHVERAARIRTELAALLTVVAEAFDPAWTAIRLSPIGSAHLIAVQIPEDRGFRDAQFTDLAGWKGDGCLSPALAHEIARIGGPGLHASRLGGGAWVTRPYDRGDRRVAYRPGPEPG